ncbi:MAG: hypothetical protein N2439_05905, partial [Anaerolineae bacterium]|nr:hypothetical protein [Anaerolineae bacterium]
MTIPKTGPDPVIHAAAIAGFAAVTLADWRLGQPAGCGFAWTPDANLFLDMGLYGRFLECLSAPGAAAHFIAVHTLGFDLVFPPLLALSVAVLVLRIAGQLPRFARLPLAARLVTASLLPLLYLAADNAENLAVMGWLKSGDSAVPALIPAMTAAKFAALGAAA